MEGIEAAKLNQALSHRIAQVPVRQSVVIVPVLVLALGPRGDARPVVCQARLVHFGGAEHVQIGQVHVLVVALGIRIPILEKLVDAG